MREKFFYCLLVTLLLFSSACNRADHKAEGQIENKMKNAKLERVDVSVKNGVATLDGEVNDENQKAQAEVLAKETPGIQNVKDNISIVYKEEYPGEKGILQPTPTNNQPSTGGGTYSGESPTTGTRGNTRDSKNQPVNVEEQKGGGYNNPVMPATRGNQTGSDLQKDSQKDSQKTDSSDLNKQKKDDKQ